MGAVRIFTSRLHKIYLFTLLLILLGICELKAVQSNRKIYLQKIKSDIERLINVAETLGARGDTHGQKEQIVDELAKRAHRFQARIEEYETLLRRATSFFANLRELDAIIERMATESGSPLTLTDAARVRDMLATHNASREQFDHLYRFVAGEGEQIVVRVRQTDAELRPDSLFQRTTHESHQQRDNVDRVVRLTEERRETWNRIWTEQRDRLEAALRIAQCAHELRDLDGELDSLELACRTNRAQLQNADESALQRAVDSQAEIDAQIASWSTRLRAFTTQCDATIRSIASGAYPQASAAQIGALQNELGAVERKWARFSSALREYRTAFSVANEYFNVLKQLENFNSQSAVLIVQIGRRLPQCGSSMECATLISQTNEALASGSRLDDVVQRLPEQAIALFGPDGDARSSRPFVVKYHETISALRRAQFDLQLTHDNLASREETARLHTSQDDLVARRTIVSNVFEMEPANMPQNVMREASASLSVPPPKPVAKEPVITQPLSNMEVLEGTKYVFLLVRCKNYDRQADECRYNQRLVTILQSNYGMPFRVRNARYSRSVVQGGRADTDSRLRNAHWNRFHYSYYSSKFIK